jgi:hypothetical protein
MPLSLLDTPPEKSPFQWILAEKSIEKARFRGLEHPHNFVGFECVT